MLGISEWAQVPQGQTDEGESKLSSDTMEMSSFPSFESTSIYKANCEKFGSCFKYDLMKESISHVNFLRGMHRLGYSWRKWTSEKSSSFRRYAEMWLPLVVKCHREGKEQQLIPPPDVAWIWHCHRLAPVAYLRHTRENFGLESNEYLEARPPFEFQEKELAGVKENETSFLSSGDGTNYYIIKNQTRILWEKLYPDEPFFIDDAAGSNAVGEEDTEGVLSGYHVLASCERQSTFLYQISQPRFAYLSFIQEAVMNYARFLYLRSTDSGRKVIIVPTYQIDLMWHTHILSNMEAYDNETNAIMGHLLYHDDSMNDRSSGSSLQVAFKATSKLWMATYNEQSYYCPGGMYRGEPPSEYWSPSWPQENPLLLVSSSWEDASKKFRSSVDISANDGDGVNNVNMKQEDDINQRMIFGYGTLGHGQYSLDSKEGVRILLNRVSRRCRNFMWYSQYCPQAFCSLLEILTLKNRYVVVYDDPWDGLMNDLRYALAVLLTLLFATIPFLIFTLLDPLISKYDNLRTYLHTLSYLDGPPAKVNGMSLPQLQDKWRGKFVGGDGVSNCHHVMLGSELLKEFPN